MAEIQVTDAQGNVHIFPDAATPDMIAKVMNVKPPSSPIDLSNRMGQGTYSMKNPAGNAVPVPYGQVQTAAQQGYQFADDANKFRYAKDNAADPNRVTSFTPAAGDPRANQDYQDQMERNAPLPIQIAGGMSKAAGTLARPLLDVAALGTGTTPQQMNEMLVSRSPAEAAAKYATLGAAALPAAAAAPVATAAGVAAGGVGSAVGKMAGSAAGLSPAASEVVSDIGGIGAGAAGAEGSNAASPFVRAEAARMFPRLAENPEGLITQAVRGSVNKNNINWNSDLSRAIPLVKSTEQAMGGKITDIDSAVDAARSTLQGLWNRYTQFQGPSAQMGATIDGNQVADAMVKTIGPRMLQNNPQRAAQIIDLAERYRRPIPVSEAEEFLSGKGGVNNDLYSYYAKNKANRRAAEADPDMAATVAEGDALRDALYSKMDDLFGPGASQLKKDYGAVKNMLNVLQDRKLVYERQAPVNLPEQRAYVNAAGKLLTGNMLGAAREVAAQRYLSSVNDTNSLIERAFGKASPAPASPVPARVPIRGMLPRGPIPMGAPEASARVNAPEPAFSPTTRAQRLGLMLPARAGGELLPYTPQMTEGEHIASLMHYLRSQQPLALPAQGAPIPLPPKF